MVAQIQGGRGGKVVRKAIVTVEGWATAQVLDNVASSFRGKGFRQGKPRLHEIGRNGTTKGSESLLLDIPISHTCMTGIDSR
jgi:hypothetical protein